MPTPADRADAVHRQITDAIIADLRAGTAPWRRSWQTPNVSQRPLRQNGEPYRGINILLLWAAAIEHGYVAPHWMTYRQAATLDAQVRRGERASHVFFVKTYTARDHDDTDPDAAGHPVHVRRAYAVFNADQIDDLPEKYRVEIPDVNTGERIAHCETWFGAIPADVRHGGGRAFYSPSDDFVRMPPFSTFESPAAYYAVLAHELVHWTGASKRADRPHSRTDQAAYAFEELVAELGAAFLCADLGLAVEPRADHASYIATWLKALKNDHKAIAQAASLAQDAVDFLHRAAQPAAEAA